MTDIPGLDTLGLDTLGLGTTGLGTTGLGSTGLGSTGLGTLTLVHWSMVHPAHHPGYTHHTAPYRVTRGDPACRPAPRFPYLSVH